MSDVKKSLAGWGAQKGDVFYYHGRPIRGADRVFDQLLSGTYFCSNNQNMADDDNWCLVRRANDYNNGLWHGWNGGECPVHPFTLVECYGGTQWAVEITHPIKSCAKFRRWSEINAFRVIKEYVEPPKPVEPR